MPRRCSAARVGRWRPWFARASWSRTAFTSPRTPMRVSSRRTTSDRDFPTRRCPRSSTARCPSTPRRGGSNGCSPRVCFRRRWPRRSSRRTDPWPRDPSPCVPRQRPRIFRSCPSLASMTAISTFKAEKHYSPRSATAGRPCTPLEPWPTGTAWPSSRAPLPWPWSYSASSRPMSPASCSPRIRPPVNAARWSRTAATA